MCEKCNGELFIIENDSQKNTGGYPSVIPCPNCYSKLCLSLCDFEPKYYSKVFTLEDFKENLQVLQFKIVNNFIENYPKPIKYNNIEKYGFYLYGGYGSGKTSLTATIIFELFKRKKIKITDNDNIPKFISMNSIFDIIRQQNFSPDIPGTLDNGYLLEKLKSHPFYIFDDFGTQNMTRWILEQLYIIFNARYSQNNFQIITSNVSLQGVYSFIEASKMQDYEKKNFERILDRWQESLIIIKMGNKNYRKDK